jgi:anti-sigma factor RsiW
MNCDDARIRLLDLHRGRLAPDVQDDLRDHLEACADCARADVVERELTSILEQRLPQHPGSLALKRRLAEEWPAPSVDRPRWSRWRPWLVPAFAVAAAALVTAPVVYYERASSRAAAERADMVTEAVNDHLRLLVSQHPLEIESSAFHQVKPWFEGRLDFAPAVAFEGNDEFPLKGGAVGYFKDRRAAVWLYARRLHPISLLVFRAEGLPWPARGLTRIGSVDALETTERGFTVILWRRGELGYALVSDVNAGDLLQLASKIAAGQG